MIELKLTFTSIEELKNFLGQEKLTLSGLDPNKKYFLSDIAGIETPEQKQFIDPPKKPGIRLNKPWTDIELQYLKDNYYNFTAKQIAKNLMRTPQSVTMMISKLTKICIIKLS